MNGVVPTGDITSVLDNLEMDTTSDQSHTDQMMARLFQMMDTNKILEDKIKQLSKRNAILVRQGQKDKKATKNI